MCCIFSIFSMILPILTASLLFNYDNFLFDLDGVVKNGDEYLPDTIRLVNYLQEKGKNVVFLSNSDWHGPAERAAIFRSKGMKYVNKHSFIIPSMVAVDYLREKGYSNSLFYALVTPYVQDRLRNDLNATLIEENPRIIDEWNFAELRETIEKTTPEFVILGSYRKWTMESIAKCMNWLKNKNVKFIVLPSDTHYMGGYGITLPDVGALLMGIEKVTGRKAEVMGKPSPALNAFISKTRKFDPKRTIMFGDNLYTDIAMARQNEFDSAMVLTGVSTMKDVDKAAADNCYCIPQYLANFTAILSDLEKWTC